MQSKQNERRAAGSLAIVGGAIALTVSTGLGTPPLFSLLLGLGVTAVMLNARVDLSLGFGYPMHLMLRRSIAVLVFGTALAASVHAGVFRTVGRVSGSVIVDAATSSTVAMLVGLQVGCLVAVELLYWVVPILDDWLPAKAKLRNRILEPFGFRLETVPTAYWAFLAVQLLAVFSGWGPRWLRDTHVAVGARGRHPTGVRVGRPPSGGRCGHPVRTGGAHGAGGTARHHRRRGRRTSPNARIRGGGNRWLRVGGPRRRVSRLVPSVGSALACGTVEWSNKSARRRHRGKHYRRVDSARGGSSVRGDGR